MSASTTFKEPDLSHKEILEVLTGLLAMLFVAMVSSTIVSTALPTIIGDLKGSQTSYTWVVTTTLLAMTVTSPIWSKLSDLFDKKLLVQISGAVFLLGSLAAGFAQMPRRRKSYDVDGRNSPRPSTAGHRPCGLQLGNFQGHWMTSLSVVELFLRDQPFGC